jgi:hypothetical protein
MVSLEIVKCGLCLLKRDYYSEQDRCLCHLLLQSEDTSTSFIARIGHVERAPDAFLAEAMRLSTLPPLRWFDIMQLCFKVLNIVVQAIKPKVILDNMSSNKTILAHHFQRSCHRRKLHQINIPISHCNELLVLISSLPFHIYKSANEP